MPYKVVLTADAARDFQELDKSVKEQVARQLRKLETSPHLGEHLGIRGGINLTGYFKIYVARKAFRIVYRIVELEVTVEVVALGKRENLTVYRQAAKRILKASKSHGSS